MRTEQFGTRPVSVGSYGCWSHMDEAKPLPSSTAPTSQARPMIASVEWQNLWAAAGGVAGGAAIVYAVGAAVEALRLDHAGLPVEQTISVVPRTAMLALAINALLLPALIAAVVIGAVILWSQRFTDREPDPADLALKQAAREARVARRELRISEAGPFRRRARAILTPVFVRAVAPGWNATIGRLPANAQGWALIGVVYFLFLPWTVSAIVLYVGNLSQFFLINAIARHRAMRVISRRREAVLIAILAGLAVSSQAMIREVFHPGPLPRASVKIAGQSKETRGAYVATTPEGVYLGVNRTLILIPDRLADRTTVWNAPEPQPEKAETLIHRID